MRGDRGMRFMHGKITDTVMGTLHLATCVCVCAGPGQVVVGGGIARPAQRLTTTNG